MYEMSTAFDATTSSIPLAPPGTTRLTRITFESCPGSSLALELVCDAINTIPIVDNIGISTDAWWVIRCTDLPDRYFRITRGTHSMTQLLRRYGFQDASGCVNHRRARAHYRAAFVPGTLDAVPKHLRDAHGVPQFHIDSGVCWYATMCWTSMANRDVRELLMSYIHDPVLRTLYERSIYDRESAVGLRRRLWYDYQVGDDVEQPPRLDGQNGFTQFCILCAKLGVPMHRLRERDGRIRPLDARLVDQKGAQVRLATPRNNEPHLLAIRFQDGDHQRFPILRRIEYRRNRYRLAGVYMGQKKCGHQIGMASPSGDWREWSIADADLHKDGIGPLFIRFDGERWRTDWWKAWGGLVHVTKFGFARNEFCSLSPHNLSNDALDVYRGAPRSGTCSIDLVYSWMR